MGKDPWMRDIHLNDEQLAAYRKEQVERSDAAGVGTPDRFTCDGCPLARKCLLAFDPYNTDGDCLYEK